MLSSPITIPMWIFAGLVFLSTLFVIDRIFIPALRWVMRRRVKRVITEVSEHLEFEIRPFQLTKRKVLIDRLTFDPVVAEAVDSHVQQSGQSRDEAMEEVRTYAAEIVPSFNAWIYYRCVWHLCRSVTRLFYRVRLGVADEEKIFAIDRDATVVFVMNHRSNFDYLLVAYLASRQTTLSYAAGEWARVFLLESVIRAMGAFFVRRDSGNPLYRAVLKQYVHMATREGVCQAVFPEGRLTTTGALAKPRLGFIDYMLRDFDVTRHRDVVFLPVGINYDKVLEDQIQIDAGKGILVNRSPRKWFSFATRSLLMYFTRRKDRRRDLFGYASVNFGLPISAKDFASRLDINFIDLDKDERFDYTEMLVQRVMNGVGYVIPILPVPLIAQAFCYSNRQVMPELQVISAVHDLIDDLIEKGAPINDSETPSRKTMQKSLALMVHHGLLESKPDGFRAANGAQERLQYYANSIEHWYGGIESIEPLQHQLTARITD